VLLALMERIIGPRLPVTAGQLASFMNDGTALADPVVASFLPSPRGMSDILGAPPNAGWDSAGAVDEFLRFAEVLGTRAPHAEATEAYRRGHEAAASIPGDALDRWLLVWARASGIGCRLADTYARLVRPYGPLRRRLILTLAVLESTPGVHAAYDAARVSSPAFAWLAVAGRGTIWVAQLLAAVLLFGSVHLVLLATSPRGARD
jgi:hypothetical protein